MKLNLSRNRSGDTLIEVIFAVAILGTLIGFAYTGAIAARKSAVAAEQRTQAVLQVQYQAEALKGYRSSLPWNDEGVPSSPNFLFGGTNQSVIPEIRTDGVAYCMQSSDLNINPVSPDPPQWEMITLTNTNNCDGLVPSLAAPSGNSHKVQINFGYIDITSGTVSQSCGPSTLHGCKAVRAEIGVYWTDPFGNQQNTKNIVLLTEQQ